MTREQFETYLKQISTSIKAEEPGEAFNKGYAMGKLVGGMYNNMTDEEIGEFMEGFLTGKDLESKRNESAIVH